MADPAGMAAAGVRAVLVSTYELGRQPFGLASPAAWLREAGATVECVDLAVEKFDERRFGGADVIAFYLPMHTATRLATAIIPRVQQANPAAHLCAYGLYASANAEYLTKLGIETILGGEFEHGLQAVAVNLARSRTPERLVPAQPAVSLARQKFLVPQRVGLPALSRYAKLNLPGGDTRTVGYTEASRGCKHLCRHCPIVPVYDGQFRIVQRDVVMADIRQQVALGAEHITFGDPDFFNGIGHVVPLVQQLHAEFPNLTYDATIKVEHLLKHAGAVSTLRDTGCIFVTTAVESVDDEVLRILDKGHTRADVIRVVGLFDEVGLALVPTFVAFTPWTTLDSYEDLLFLLARLGLVDRVAPVQLAIRLLIPNGSRLLGRPELDGVVGKYDERLLSYRWTHNDPRVDDLQRQVEALVRRSTADAGSRSDVFGAVCRLLHGIAEKGSRSLPPAAPLAARSTIPYLTEPWFC